MRNLLILFAAVSVVALAAFSLITYLDNNFKYGRMWETPAVRPQEQPINLTESGTVPFSGGEELYRAADGSVLASPLPLTDAVTIASGKDRYFVFCAQCHGADHDGNGTVGQSFQPLPTDLQSARVQDMAPGVMFKEISFGLPNGRQPPLASTISVPDRWCIVAYVKSLEVRQVVP